MIAKLLRQALSSALMAVHRRWPDRSGHSLVKRETMPCSIHSSLSRARSPSLSPPKQQRHRRHRRSEFGRARSQPSPYHFRIDRANSSALFHASTSTPLKSTSSLGRGAFCHFRHRCSRRSATELHARRGQPQSGHRRSLSPSSDLRTRSQHLNPLSSLTLPLGCVGTCRRSVRGRHGRCDTRAHRC